MSKKINTADARIQPPLHRHDNCVRRPANSKNQAHAARASAWPKTTARNPPIHTWLANAEPAKKQPSGTEQVCPCIAPKRTAHAAFAPYSAKASSARIPVAVNFLHAAISHQSVWPAALGATATQVAFRLRGGIVAVRILYIRRKQAIENL